ncbi:hypothetical protein PspLS_01990 [Pyricularia sp. CBS 133598]|nr:hypothetical protein PspLS_01990 [Pyricularia sp. CBS 133598]
MLSTEASIRSSAPIMDQDGTRGWIMCIVSGIACISGASFICVDIFVRRFTRSKTFRIEDSNAFLASSLSLSFGVMIYSALANMLPEAKKEFLLSDYGEMPAGLLMMTFFVVGFMGIQVISRLMHRLMPSHVVDCDHTHGHGPVNDQLDQGIPSGPHSRHVSRSVSKARSALSPERTAITQQNGAATESTPLLSSQAPKPHALAADSQQDGDESTMPHVHSHGQVHTLRPRAGSSSLATRRPSMLQVKDRVLSFVKDTKANCDELGPCFGYTDPCGQECFKHMSARTSLSRATTRISSGPVYNEGPEEAIDGSFRTPAYRISRAQSREFSYAPSEADDHHHHNHGHGHNHNHNHNHNNHAHGQEDVEDDDDHTHDTLADDDLEAQHHHHVPTNAFMSIGLQTVIAIALHKFPEGFITYATNMASPALGFNVFMALFVHNIAEGFSMALPLYMALGSRLKAIAWSSLLGGLSQPAGAALAWLWFKVARRAHVEVDHKAYGAIYAITAGIMTSVALQLFVESLSLNHSRNLSIAFAFIGIILLGFSSSIYD